MQIIIFTELQIYKQGTLFCCKTIVLCSECENCAHNLRYRSVDPIQPNITCIYYNTNVNKSIHQFQDNIIFQNTYSLLSWALDRYVLLAASGCSVFLLVIHAYTAVPIAVAAAAPKKNDPTVLCLFEFLQYITNY